VKGQGSQEEGGATHWPTGMRVGLRDKLQTNLLHVAGRCRRMDGRKEGAGWIQSVSERSRWWFGDDLVGFLRGTATAHHHTTAHHTVGVMDCMGQHGRGFIVHFDWMDLS
jgi:hypothetical protein